jgi:hypothetical protein
VLERKKLHSQFFETDDDILYLKGFLIPPVAGADFRAAFVARCLRGAFPPVDLRAVCLVLAIVNLKKLI